MDFLRFLLRLMFDQCGVDTANLNVTGVTDIDAAIPEYWAEGVISDADRESFWGALSGAEGSRMPVIEKTGPLKSKGDQITFTTIVQLMGAGVTGDSTGTNVLAGNEQKISIGTFTVTADVIRNAVGVTRKANKQSNFDMIKQAGTLLKDWFTRKFDNDIFDTILSSSVVETIYSNSKTSQATLNSTDADQIGTAEITKLRLALQRQGAIPLMVKKTNNRTVPIYGMVMGEIEEYHLFQNSVFAQTVREIWERFSKGSDHPLLNSAIGMYDHMLIYPYYSILPIPQGTPLRPETLVLATLTTTATTLTVGTSTGDSADDYTDFFASSGSLQVEDEIISYTGLTTGTFTGLTRGVSSTTAVQHVPNKLITQRNVASVIGFGAEAIFRAMPESSEPIGDNRDYKEQIGIGIRAYYGHAVKKDARRAKANNLVVMKVYSNNPSTI